MGMVSVCILRMKDGFGGFGGAQSWKRMPKVIIVRQNLACTLSHLREGTLLEERWWERERGRICIGTCSSRKFSGGSMVLSSSKESIFVKLTLGRLKVLSIMSVGRPVMPLLKYMDGGPHGKLEWAPIRLSGPMEVDLSSRRGGTSEEGDEASLRTISFNIDSAPKSQLHSMLSLIRLATRDSSRQSFPQRGPCCFRSGSSVA
jgi:hypothetical protein